MWSSDHKSHPTKVSIWILQGCSQKYFSRGSNFFSIFHLSFWTIAKWNISWNIRNVREKLFFRKSIQCKKFFEMVSQGSGTPSPGYAPRTSSAWFYSCRIMKYLTKSFSGSLLRNTCNLTYFWFRGIFLNSLAAYFGVTRVWLCEELVNKVLLCSYRF